MGSCGLGRWMLLLVFLGLFVEMTEELRRFHEQLKADGSLSFLVVGDWGRKGLFNQSLVAAQMGKIGQKLDIDFVISTGDNFYEDGLRGVNDPAFSESFTNIYTAPSLQKTWYAVLGNHDYRDDVEAEMSPLLGQKDERWLCFRSFILHADIAEFFFVDTTPFVDEYFTNPGNNTYDWRGVLPRNNYLSNLLKDLDLALRGSTATWKIVVGHHTIKSAGYHGVTQELEVHLLPVLQENNVDVYMNGHDHCLEHISSSHGDSNMEYLTSGGGSKAWRGVMKGWDPEEMKLFYDGQGFMSVELNQTRASFVFYDIFGNILHNFSLSKHSFHSSI
ncbi:Acid phosphatase [Bertholletia excelsa]